MANDHDRDRAQPPPAAGADDGPYREYFERAADAFLIIEGDTFVDCNQATVEMLGYADRAEVLQTHPSQHSPEHQPDGRLSYAKANEMMELAFRRGSHRFEWAHKRADGTVFPVEVLLTSVHRGDRVRLHVVWRDLTERKRLENELRQAQKMDALGRLSGGVAHDFNNLLVAILGRAELLQMDLPPDSGLQEHAGEILRAGNRAADLVRQLLAFSRKQLMRPETIDLNAAVTEVRGMLAHLLGRDLHIVLDLAPEPLWITVDPGQIDQVLVNLAVNARDAMQPGGTLTIATAPAEPSAAGEAPPRVRLTVTDTGSGVAPDVLPRIFEPFFTTKDVGRGTGLGLSTVYGIVRQSGGEIGAENRPGGGMAVSILLPRSEREPAPAAAAGGGDIRSLHGSETILLVEDEEPVARLASAILERAGYRVLVAGDGQEALDLLAVGGVVPHLVLTDVVMPRVNGPELVRRLRAERPAQKALFISGYTADKLTESGLDVGPGDLVTKPFTAIELAQAVRRALDAG